MTYIFILPNTENIGHLKSPGGSKVLGGPWSKNFVLKIPKNPSYIFIQTTTVDHHTKSPLNHNIQNESISTKILMKTKIVCHHLCLCLVVRLGSLLKEPEENSEKWNNLIVHGLNLCQFQYFELHQVK